MRTLIALLLTTGLLHAGEPRSWTDLKNRKIEATMIGMEGDKVILKLKDGRKVPFPLAKLAPDDAQYAREHADEISHADSHASGGGDAGDDTEPDFDSEWPDRIKFGDDPEIVIVEENADESSFIYESAHYRYTCDVRLSKSVVKGFAVMFEATHLFCRSLPIGLTGGELTDGKLQILLLESEEDYIEAGGPVGSAGVFMGGKALVMIPLTSLGVRPVGSSYMLDRDKSSKTLPHELTHQLTTDRYYAPGGRGWFTEGIAEYVAVTPYRSGAYKVRNNHKDIADYVTGYGSKNKGGRALGEEIHIRDLKGFMLQDYSNFLENPQINYGFSLLLTYYFLQMDGDGDAARVKKFLKGLRAGKTEDEAIDILLDGRSYEELEQEITKAWGRRGVDFTFGKSS